MKLADWARTFSEKSKLPHMPHVVRLGLTYPEGTNIDVGVGVDELRWSLGACRGGQGAEGNSDNDHVLQF
jgi:hypothetical protein